MTSAAHVPDFGRNQGDQRGSVFLHTVMYPPLLSVTRIRSCCRGVTAARTTNQRKQAKTSECTLVPNTECNASKHAYTPIDQAIVNAPTLNLTLTLTLTPTDQAIVNAMYVESQPTTAARYCFCFFCKYTIIYFQVNTNTNVHAGTFVFVFT